MTRAVPSLAQAHIIRYKLSERARRDPVVALREALEQTPAASELTAGVLTAAASTVELEAERGLLRRLASMGPRGQIHRAIRCTCLIAKGFVAIGAGVDASGMDWVWGSVPQGSAHDEGREI